MLRHVISHAAGSPIAGAALRMTAWGAVGTRFFGLAAGSVPAGQGLGMMYRNRSSDIHAAYLGSAL